MVCWIAGTQNSEEKQHFGGRGATILRLAGQAGQPSCRCKPLRRNLVGGSSHRVRSVPGRSLPRPREAFGPPTKTCRNRARPRSAKQGELFMRGPTHAIRFTGCNRVIVVCCESLSDENQRRSFHSWRQRSLSWGQVRYDLLLKGGHVIDPANRIDSVVDIAISGGKIARVAAGIPTGEARKVLRRTRAVCHPGADRSSRTRIRLQRIDFPGRYSPDRRHYDGGRRRRLGMANLRGNVPAGDQTLAHKSARLHQHRWSWNDRREI